MPPPQKGKWTTKANEIQFTPGTDGSLKVRLPIYDNNVRQAWIEFTISPERALRFFVEEVAGAIGFTDFQAWMKES